MEKDAGFPLKSCGNDIPKSRDGGAWIPGQVRKGHVFWIASSLRFLAMTLWGGQATPCGVDNLMR